MSQDYNEAIQDASCFADPELAQAAVVTNALGLPVPCSGNFADVYAMNNGQRKWAVKCFTREIPGLAERYLEISSALQRVQLPFMVEFKFLKQGIRMRGQWYPILKLHWVEGFSLNTFVKNNLEKPAVLETLCQIWVRLAARLRETGMAHGDLQHGNIMLVPGAKTGALSVRLVDYDGIYVPSLELLKTIEVGHPCYQHPQRQQEVLYNLHIDQFSHLVIYTALRGLIGGGKALWDKYDNGDNLLFKQPDLLAPARSALFQELRQSSDPEVRKLSQALAAAAQKPLDQTPLLENLAPAPSTRIQAAPTAVRTPAYVTAVTTLPANAFATVVDNTGARSRVSKRKPSKGRGVVLAAVGLVALLAASGTVAGLLVLNSLKPKDDGPLAVRKDTPARVAPTSGKIASSEARVPLPPATQPELPATPQPEPEIPAPRKPENPPQPKPEITKPEIPTPPQPKPEVPAPRPEPEKPAPAKPENPPAPANTFSITSVSDVSAVPGAEAKMEIAYERKGPPGAITVDVKGLPPTWKRLPAVIQDNKVIVRVRVPVQTEAIVKRLQVTLSLGEEKAQSECNFSVKSKGSETVAEGPKSTKEPPPNPVKEPEGGLPDLVVTDITAEGPYIYVHYKNQGKGVGQGDFLIKVSSGTKSFPGNHFYRFPVPPPDKDMKTGGITLGLIGLKPGDTADVTATIDHENRVRETNKDNNTLTKKVTVPAK